MSQSAILLDICSQHEVVLFDDVLWVVRQRISENEMTSILHFPQHLHILTRQLHLLLEDVLEVFQRALAVIRLRLFEIAWWDQRTLLVKLLILSAHVEQDLRQEVLDFGFFVVLHLCQLVSLESCVKNFNELDESVVWKVLV